MSERITTPKNGEVYAFTIINNPPKGFEDQTPYVFSIVKLSNGKLIETQLTDLNRVEVEVEDENGVHIEVSYPELEIGLKVEMVTRKLFTDGQSGIISYGYKFRPLLQEV